MFTVATLALVQRLARCRGQPIYVFCIGHMLQGQYTSLGPDSLVGLARSLQCKRIFGKRTLSTSRNLKAKEGWGEIDISTKGVERWVLPTPLPAHFYQNRMMMARQTIVSL